MIAKNRRCIRLWLIQALTLSRAISGILFASISITPRLSIFTLVIYCHGTLSDFADGLLARKWGCATQGGRALDLFADKVLTISSLLYAVARGVPIIPCALLLLRETLYLSFRTIYIDDEPLIPLSGIVGGLNLVPIRFATLLLLLWPVARPSEELFIASLFWLGAMFSISTMVLSVHRNWNRIIRAFS